MKKYMIFGFLLVAVLAFSPVDNVRAVKTQKQKKCVEWLGTYDGPTFTFTFYYSTGLGVIRWGFAAGINATTPPGAGATYVSGEYGQDTQDGPTIVVDPNNTGIL